MPFRTRYSGGRKVTQRGRKSEVPLWVTSRETAEKVPRSGRSPGPSSDLGFSWRMEFLWEQRRCSPLLQKQPVGADTRLCRERNEFVDYPHFSWMCLSKSKERSNSLVTFPVLQLKYIIWQSCPTYGISGHFGDCCNYKHVSEISLTIGICYAAFSN